MKALPCLLLLVLSLCPVAIRAEALLSINNVTVTEDELYLYLKEYLVPQAYESGVRRPDAIKNALVNLYVLRRAAGIAVSEGLLPEEEIAYRQRDGGYQCFDSFRVRPRARPLLLDGGACRRALHYRARQTGPAGTAEVQHLLIELDDRSFSELMAQPRVRQTRLR